MKCPKCQHENPEDASFCNRCGCKSTLLFEPSSKTLLIDEKISKIQRYLLKGLVEKVLLQKDKIEGERKQFTVMFCDMEGLTSMVEDSVRKRHTSLWTRSTRSFIHKVHDYEGTVNEMMGDGITARFCAPIASEDAAQRAIRSAIVYF